MGTGAGAPPIEFHVAFVPAAREAILRKVPLLRFAAIKKSVVLGGAHSPCITADTPQGASVVLPYFFDFDKPRFEAIFEMTASDSQHR